MMIPSFAVDVMCIKPFDEGTGRLARLFSLLLMEKAGFDVGRYVSVDRLCERHAAAYYEALICVHVNHGLMRKGESEQVIDVFKNQMDANLVYADATDRFLGKLADVAEPVKLLYKDEVRVVGRELGLPESMVERQPFPSPGLGVRCLGAITRDRLEALREADAIVREEIDKAGLTIWQYFAVVPDLRATGVRDGKRAYDWPCIIRCINTVDVMTAEVPELDWALLKRITARITAEVPGICRVCYDLTPKPVGTVEWE